MEQTAETPHVEIPEHLGVEKVSDLPKDASESLRKTRAQEEQEFWQTTEQLENAANIAQKKDPDDLKTFADKMRETYPDVSEEDAMLAARKNFEAYGPAIGKYKNAYDRWQRAERDSYVDPAADMNWEDVRKQREALDSVKYAVHSIAERINRIGMRSAADAGQSSGTTTPLDVAVGPKVDVTNIGANGDGRTETNGAVHSPEGIGPESVVTGTEANGTNGNGHTESEDSAITGEKATGTSADPLRAFLDEKLQNGSSESPKPTTTIPTSSSEGASPAPYKDLSDWLKSGDKDLSAREHAQDTVQSGGGASFMKTPDSPLTSNAGGLEAKTGSPAGVDMTPKTSPDHVSDEQTTKPEQYADHLPNSQTTQAEDDSGEKKGPFSWFHGFGKQEAKDVAVGAARVSGAAAVLAAGLVADSAISQKPHEVPINPPGPDVADPHFGDEVMKQVQPISTPHDERAMPMQTEDPNAVIPPDDVPKPSVEQNQPGATGSSPELAQPEQLSPEADELLAPWDPDPNGPFTGQLLTQRLEKLGMDASIAPDAALVINDLLVKIAEKNPAFEGMYKTTRPGVTTQSVQAVNATVPEMRPVINKLLKAQTADDVQAARDQMNQIFDHLPKG